MGQLGSCTSILSTSHRQLGKRWAPHPNGEHDLVEGRTTHVFGNHNRNQLIPNHLMPDAPAMHRENTTPQVALCRHRMGMICAATGDHRAAAQLLAESAQRYGAASGSSSGGAQGGGLSGLAREAAVGQALAK